MRLIVAEGCFVIIQESTGLRYGHSQLVLHRLIAAQPFQNKTERIYAGSTYNIGSVLPVQDRQILEISLHYASTWRLETRKLRKKH